MSYLDTLMMNGERVVYRSQLHWVIYINGMLVTILGWSLALAGPDRVFGLIHLDPPGFVASFYKMLVCGIVLFGCFLLLLAFIRQTTTELAVTNCRVLAKFGWIRRETFEIFLTKVEGANIEQPPLGRVLNFGCVHVHGTGGGTTPFDLVFSPRDFQLAIIEQIEAAQSRGAGPVAAARNG